MISLLSRPIMSIDILLYLGLLHHQVGFTYLVTSLLHSLYNQGHDRDSNILQSFPRKTWESIRFDHAEASREPAELVVLPGDNPCISHSREDPGS